MQNNIKILRGFFALLLALILYGVLVANGLCDIGGNVCTNWTSSVSLVRLWLLLTLSLLLIGVLFIIKDLYLNKKFSWKKKAALSLAMTSIIGVPYSVVITPILIAVAVKYVK